MKPLQEDYLGVQRTETPVQGTVHSIQLSKGSLQKHRRDVPAFNVGYGMQRPLKAGLCKWHLCFYFIWGKGGRQAMLVWNSGYSQADLKTHNVAVLGFLLL